MNNEQHINETESESRMIAADLRNGVPVWLENEDGSGQWSDGWTGPDSTLGMLKFESDVPF